MVRMDTDVIVIGAGMSGLSVAWRLAARGVSVCVLESAAAVGGLAGTLRTGPYAMDVGPHSFFSEDDVIREAVLDLFEGALVPQPRRVKFYFKGRFLDYPLTARGVLFQMGLGSGLRAACSYAVSRMRAARGGPAGEEQTVEAWAIASFGEHLYRTFFKPYTEQFWKVPCTELSSRAIPTHTRMSFVNTCRLLLRKRLSKVAPSLIEREMLPTYYPESGFDEIAIRVAAAARRAGARIELGCRALAVEDAADRQVSVRYERAGAEETLVGRHVVSTVPIPEFLGMLTPSPPSHVAEAGACLDYRALTALGMVTDKQSILGCSYVYVLNRPYNRMCEMNEFSPATSPAGENILVVEFPCLRGSPVWAADKQDLFDMCIGSLAEDGFLAPGDVKDLLLVRAPHAYPVYRRGYAAALETVLAHVRGRRGVSTLGRTGEFMYMDVDACMRRAFAWADTWGENGATVL